MGVQGEAIFVLFLILVETLQSVLHLAMVLAMDLVYIVFIMLRHVLYP